MPSGSWPRALRRNGTPDGEGVAEVAGQVGGG